jgi:hypothetical protein
VRLQLRRYDLDGSDRDAGFVRSLAEARRRYPNLERDRHPDLLDALGVTRAYSAVFCHPGADSRALLDHVLVAYPWRPRELPPWQRAELVWDLPPPGRMTVLPDGRSVLCHECGVPTHHAGLHARRAHGLSPDRYRSRFGIANRVPLCSPSYSEGRRRSALRTGTARNVLPHRWRRRLPTRVEAHQLASFDFNARG